MSFGFGVGDIIALSKLANTVWSHLRDSSGQLKVIRSEIAGLKVVLDSVAEKISSSSLDLKEQERLASLMLNCRDVLADVQKLLTDCQILDTSSPSLASKTKKAWKKIGWSEREADRLRDRIVSTCTLLDTFNNLFSSEIAAKTSKDVLIIDQQVQKLRLNNEDQERQKVLDWLSPVNFSAEQDRLLSRRQEGTGSWLLARREIQDWIKYPGRTLLCIGMPGAGKTMSACFLINHLQKISTAKTAVLYYYGDYRKEQEQMGYNGYGTFLKQLLQYQSSIPDYFMTLFRQHTKNDTHFTDAERFEMFESLTSAFDSIYLVVDALDEVPKELRRKVLPRFGKSPTLHNRINVLFTSRDIPQILDEIDWDDKLEIRADEEDIRKYVAGRIDDLPSFVSRRVDIQKSISDAVVTSAEGMFLLAQFNIDILADRTTPKSMKTALADLPKGNGALHAAYDQIMQRINKQSDGLRSLAIRALTWITFAERLLSFTELRHALAVEPGEECFDEDNLDDGEQILSVCAGLVGLDQDTQIVSLVHYTTQEYLRGPGNQHLSKPHEMIALTCLTYLLFDDYETAFYRSKGWLDSEPKSDLLISEDKEYIASIKLFNPKVLLWAPRFLDPPRLLETELRQYPLAFYAACYWGVHVRRCPNAVLEPIVAKLLEQPRKVVAASLPLTLELLYPFFNQDSISQNEKDNTDREPVYAIHLASYFGLMKVVCTLLEDVKSVAFMQDYTGKTALDWAAYGGHREIFKILLKHEKVTLELENVNRH